MGCSPQHVRMAAATVCNCCKDEFAGTIYNERDLGEVCAECHYRCTRAASELACEGIAGCIPASGGFAGPKKKTK